MINDKEDKALGWVAVAVAVVLIVVIFLGAN